MPRQKANGLAARAAHECTSTRCADGVCCNTACTGACQACTAAKKGRGRTAPAVHLAGTDPDTECAAQAATTCGTTGICNGSGACALYASGTLCGAATCAGNRWCPRGSATAPVRAGSAATAPSCAPYTCAAAACNDCATDADCPGY